MRHILQGAVIGLGLLAISAGTALAQMNANENGPDSVIIQNDEGSPNSGQQGGSTQLQNDAEANIAGDNSSILLSDEDVSVNSTAAQAVGSTAVGGSYTEVDEGGNLSTGGDVLEIDGDLAIATSGHAVDDGATTVGGGIAFGANVDVDDSFAIVGGSGAALLSETDELADEGSAIVVGSSNATATAHDDAAVVGSNGSALFVDEADDWSVYGSDNHVSQNELDQEVATTDGSPIISVGAWTPETTDDLGQTDEASNPSIVTGDIGGTGNGISVTGLAGLNAMHINTGAMNQGSIHAVAATVDSINF